MTLTTTRALQAEMWLGFWDTPLFQCCGLGIQPGWVQHPGAQSQKAGRGWGWNLGLNLLGKERVTPPLVQFLCYWEEKELAAGLEWVDLASLHLHPAVLHTFGMGLAAPGENLSPPIHYWGKHWWVCFTFCFPQVPGAQDWAAFDEAAWRGEVGKKSLITPPVCSWTRADVIKFQVIS